MKQSTLIYLKSATLRPKEKQRALPVWSANWAQQKRSHLSWMKLELSQKEVGRCRWHQLSMSHVLSWCLSFWFNLKPLTSRKEMQKSLRNAQSLNQVLVKCFEVTSWKSSCRESGREADRFLAWEGSVQPGLAWMLLCTVVQTHRQ